VIEDRRLGASKRRGQQDLQGAHLLEGLVVQLPRPPAPLILPLLQPGAQPLLVHLLLGRNDVLRGGQQRPQRLLALLPGGAH